MIYNVEPEANQSLWRSMLKDTVDLRTALQSAKGGDIINLAPGKYELAETIELNIEQTRGIVPNDPYYQGAFENTWQQNIPADPIIIRGDVTNSSKVIIEGQLLVNTGTLALEGLSFLQKYKDDSGIVLYNDANLVLNGVNIQSLYGSTSVSVYGQDENTVITAVSSGIVAGPNDTTNITINGVGYFYSCDLGSGPYLKGRTNIIAGNCQVNWINVTENSHFSGLNSVYSNKNIEVSDNATIDCSNSKFLINGNRVANIYDSGKFIGNNLTFESNDGTKPEIHIFGNDYSLKAEGNEKINYYLGENAPFEFVDNGRKVMVQSNEALIDAIENGQSGDQILLNSGEYKWSSNYNLLPNDFHIVGLNNDPNKTILYLVDGLEAKESAKISIKNLTLRKKTTDNHMSLVAANNKGSNVIVENCILYNEDTEKVVTYTDNDAILNLINCRFVSNSVDSYEIRANSNSKINISDSVVDKIVACDNSQIIIKNSKFNDLVYAESKSKVKFENSTFSINNSELSGKAFDDSQLIFKYVDFKSSNENIKFEVSNNAKVQFDLIKCDDDLKLQIAAEDPSKQIINPKNYEFITLNQDNNQKRNQELQESKPQINQEAKQEIDQNNIKPVPTLATNPESIEAYQELMNLIGLNKVKSQIDIFIKTAIFNKKREATGLKTTGMTLHSCFVGNPGTGKTTVARLVGKILYGYGILQKPDVKDVTRSDLVANYIGQTSNKTKKVLKNATGGVLLIDEAYTLYNADNNDYGREALDEILKYMEDHRDEIMIIFTGYPEEMQNLFSLNPGLRSRIPNNFDFEDYTSDEIVHIGLNMLETNDYKLGANVELYKDLVKKMYEKATDQSNARWIRNVNQKLINQLGTDNISGKNDSLDTFTKQEIELVLG